MISTAISVGRISANCPPNSANWIQLASLCQLDNHTNHEVTFQLAMSAVGRTANLPTDASDCFLSTCILKFVVGNSLPPSGGEKHCVFSPPNRRGLPWLKQSGNHFGVSIMTLDLGTQTGWALLSRDGSVASGSESFKPRRFEGGGMRYLRFKRWLTEMKQCADGIDAVFMEEVRRHAGVDAAHAYGGFLATLTAWCEHHNIPYQGVPVGTIKKHATGKGNASKEQMIAAVQTHGYTPIDDNEADALALLHWALEHGGTR